MKDTLQQHDLPLHWTSSPTFASCPSCGRGLGEWRKLQKGRAPGTAHRSRESKAKREEKAANSTYRTA